MMVHALLHHPRGFSSRSGMYPLVQALGATPVYYDLSWEKLQARSWTAGQALRRWGNWYYGSEWNALIPYLDERRLCRKIPSPGLAHFLWGEFASPRHPDLFRRKGLRVMGTFHCSARRQKSVLAPWRDFRGFEIITLMSETQRPFFLERGVEEDRLHVILHGVDGGFFCPGPADAPRSEGPLRGLLVGNTERDHEFMAAVLDGMRPEIFRLKVCADTIHRPLYENRANVEWLPFLSDEQLRAEYRAADLLVMPLLDCTANNAVLEAMACGTPVMTNRVGGTPEYVDEGANFLMAGKNADEWIDRLKELAGKRSLARDRREPARAWALKFDWKCVAPHYRNLYDRQGC